jgi:1L-myo-inositol 1-phosphate cytidylyltransferase / CDP-L-myo-inositol myo-inositolphosphotransferase
MAEERVLPVQRAVVLAAGNGDRFRNGSTHSKLTTFIGGVPLLARTLASAHLAGVTDAYVVLGFDADRVRALAEAEAPNGLALHFHLNPEWHRENGLSVLAVRGRLSDGPFALVMGDHLFDARVLRRMLRTPRRGAALLAVDSRIDDAHDTSEATKVRLRDGVVTAIGKTIEPFDALDTGLFVCEPPLFAALDAARGEGDTTLSAGIARLASRGLVRGMDIGDASWCDVDTVEDLETAEDVARRLPPS